MADRLRFNKPNWNKMVKDIVDTECVKRMHRVADACNAGLPLSEKAESPANYMVSVQGDKPLSKRGYRATVITATGAAMRDNASNNTLVHNLHLAGGN
jgi:hypothetical protein